MTPPTHIPPAPEGSAQEAEPSREGEALVTFLEHKQLVSGRSVAVPPARLSRRARAALWLLRIFALLVSLMVIYTFISHLH